MISKSKQFLCMFCLIGSATTVSGIQLEKLAGADLTMPANTDCFTGSHRHHQTVSVTFAHGDVSDQRGQSIEAGSTLAVDEIVSVSSDGFLSVHFDDGQTVNLQPDTSTSIACALSGQSDKLDVEQPYRVGAIRG